MRTIQMLVTAAVAAVVVGCNPMPGNPAEDYTPPSEAGFDQQIEKIKADPNMTEDAKQHAIQGIEMAKRMTQQGGKGAGKQ